MSAEETAPEGQDFKATEVDLGQASEIPGVSRERLAAIDRQFFEEHKQEMQNQLKYVVEGIKAIKQSLVEAKEAEYRPEHIGFLESRLETEEKIQGILQGNIDQADAGLARLDAEEAGSAT